MNKLLFLLLLCSFQAIATDTPVFPVLGQTNQTLAAFVPKGHFILNQAAGDLNKDGLADAVLVLANEKEKDPALTEELARSLLIFFGKADAGYELKAVSSQALLCRLCGGMMGDPLQPIAIERGAVVISHYGGSRDRWGNTHRFRYQDYDFYLIGKTTVTQDIMELTETETDSNLITGLTVIKQTRQGKVVKNSQSKTTPKPLVKLKDFDI